MTSEASDISNQQSQPLSVSASACQPCNKPAVSCSRRGCRVTNEPISKCPGQKCDKALHLSCFKSMYGKKDWFPLIKSGIACTKKCHQSIRASASTKPSWKNDGANGPDDPCCSERILLDWLLEPGNYANKWRGKDNKGDNKKQVALSIATEINSKGVKVERDSKQVINKIHYIERQFRDAFDFSNTETGQGLMEDDPDGFDGAVLKICPNYFDLRDIFGDRASAKPKATSDDVLESSSESESQSSGGDRLVDMDEFSFDGDDYSSSYFDCNDEDGGANDDGDDAADHGNNNEEKQKRTKQNRNTTTANDNKDKKTMEKNKRKNVMSKKSSPSIASSSKKSKPVASILDTDTSNSIKSLTAKKEEFMDEQLKRLRTAEKFENMKRLKEIRETFPLLEDAEILNMFPEFDTIIKFVKKS